jgi:hypothetical protein
MEPHGQARGTIITPRWGEHPVPEDQFTHGQGRGPNNNIIKGFPHNKTTKIKGKYHHQH